MAIIVGNLPEVRTDLECANGLRNPCYLEVHQNANGIHRRCITAVA